MGSIGEMMADGGFTGPTAWVLVDYKGQPGFRGPPFFTPKQIHANIEEGHKLGWQYGIHAIGDAAIAMTVDAFDTKSCTTIRATITGTILCHFTVLPPGTDPADHGEGQDPHRAAAELHLQSGRPLRGNARGQAPGHQQFHRDAHQHGIYMAFGSDNLPIGPMVGLYAAVTRKGESGKVYGPAEAVSIKDALTMYTRNGAFLTREENIKGTLEPGKLADMIVLPEDPLSISPGKLLGLKVDMTIIGGKVLYDRSRV